jgi:hypothetical protein
MWTSALSIANLGGRPGVSHCCFSQAQSPVGWGGEKGSLEKCGPGAVVEWPGGKAGCAQPLRSALCRRGSPDSQAFQQGSVLLDVSTWSLHAHVGTGTSVLYGKMMPSGTCQVTNNDPR